MALWELFALGGTTPLLPPRRGASSANTESARYWPHAAVPGVGLLRARFLTHRYSRHAHETFALGLVEAGAEEFEYGGTLLRAGRGAVALLNPEVVHTGQAAGPGGWTYRVLYPAVHVVTDVAAELSWPRGTPSFPETVTYEERSARLLLAAHVAAERGDPLASSSLLATALAGLLRAHARAGPGVRPPAARRAPGAVAAVRDLLSERLTDPPRLGDLALATGMSPFALLRAFRDETGLPPHAYLNQLRVRLARRLLDGGLAPAVVAAEAGFADQAHLTRHFKRVVGVPPGAYQRERGHAREPEGKGARRRAGDRAGGASRA
jgi:AraC-like DNA-binding protein